MYSRKRLGYLEIRNLSPGSRPFVSIGNPKEQDFQLWMWNLNVKKSSWQWWHHPDLCIGRMGVSQPEQCCSERQPGGWGLENPLCRPLFFLYFREFREKHWPSLFRLSAPPFPSPAAPNPGSGRSGETALTAALNLSPSFTKRPTFIPLWAANTDQPTSSEPHESFEFRILCSWLSLQLRF